MIKAEFFRDSFGSIVKFEIKGHAGFQSENDIVCAAVSAVSYAVLNGIENVLDIKAGYETDDGYLYFVLPDDLDDASKEKVNILLNTLYLFIKDLSEQHKKHVAVKESEV